MKKVILDTNVYVDWLNRGQHEEVMLGAALARYLCSIVYMELVAGAKGAKALRTLARVLAAYQTSSRVAQPPFSVHERAGWLLRGLRASGTEIRQASIVNDVLIALTAR